MKTVSNWDELKVGKYYAFTPKKEYLPYLDYISRITALPSKGKFEVFNYPNVIWDFDKFEAIDELNEEESERAEDS